MNQSYCPKCATTEHRDTTKTYECKVCGLITQPDEDANENDETIRN